MRKRPTSARRTVRQENTWRFELNRWKSSSAWIPVLLALLALSISPGCSDDPVEVGGRCEPFVNTHLIITNPLMPAPGDTTQLTIQNTGEGCGNWPSYHWTVEGGELIEDEGISVRWKAPEEYGAYRVVCRASLTGASPDTSETLVTVRDIDYIDTDKRITLKPMSAGSNNLYVICEAVDESPSSPDFLGWHLYRRFENGTMQKLTNTGEARGAGAVELILTGDESKVFGSFIIDYNTVLRQQKVDVWSFNLGIMMPGVNASRDLGGSIYLRKNQHRYPYPNSNGTKAVWKNHSVGELRDGTDDLYNIVYWDAMDGEGDWTRITRSLDSIRVIYGSDTAWVPRYFENIKPMFTPLEDYILYFADTTGAFEPCLIPMTGGAPDTTGRRALMVTRRVGIFEQADVYIGESTVFEWIPGTNVLSFIAGGKIRFFDYQTETVVTVDELSKLEEFAWSHDGSQMAAVSDIGVHLVSASGVVSPIPLYYLERSTDEIKGINWNNSDTEPQIVFRLVRKGKSEVDSWTALVIIDLNSGLWAYASPSFPWQSSREPSGVDYTWLRAVFDETGTGIYAPIPIRDDVNYPDKDVILIYSHE
jgi:hypothetical protein